MPVIPSQSGFFWGALGQALQGLPSQAMQYQKMQQDQKAQDLRAKMLDLQTQALTDKLNTEKQAQAARDAAFNEQTRQIPMGGAVNGPADEAGNMPQQPPPQYRPQSMEELRNNPVYMGNVYKAQPKEYTTGVMKNLFPTNSSLHGGFDTIEEAQAAAKAGGINPRIHQLSTGKWAVDQIAPVNPGADTYHRVYAQGIAAGLSPQAAGAAAMAELQNFNYGNANATGAGGIAGRAGAFLGEPSAPYLGVQGSTAIPPAPQMPAPSPGPSSRNIPAPNTGTYPTSNAPTAPAPSEGPPGETPAQRAERLKGDIHRNTSALPEGEVTAIAQGGILDQLVGKTRQSFKEEYLHPYASDIELAMRRRFGGQQVMGMTVPGEVSPGELNFRQNLRNLQNLIVYLQTGKQINENEAKRLESAIPQPYEKSKESFDSALSNFHSLVRAIVTEHAKAAGLSRGGAAGAVQGRLIPTQ